MSNENLIHLAYVSESSRPMDKQDIMDILAVSRAKNHERDITGILLYYKDSFFQALEGDAAAVEALYAKICQDPRNTKNTELVKEPIAERQFANWTMGYAEVTQQDLSSIEGLNDFFLGANCFMQLSESDVKTLLAVFYAVDWRQKFEENATLMKTLADANAII